MNNKDRMDVSNKTACLLVKWLVAFSRESELSDSLRLVSILRSNEDLNQSY